MSEITRAEIPPPGFLPSKNGPWRLPGKFDILVSSYHRTRLLNHFDGHEKIMLVYLNLYYRQDKDKLGRHLIYRDAMLRILHMNEKQVTLDLILRVLRAFGVSVEYSIDKDGKWVLQNVIVSNQLRNMTEWLLDGGRLFAAKNHVTLVHSAATFSDEPKISQRCGETATSLLSLLNSSNNEPERIRELLPHLFIQNAESLALARQTVQAALANRWILFQMFKNPHQRYSPSPRSPRINGVSFNRLSREVRHTFEKAMGWTVCDLTSCGATIFANLYKVEALLTHALGADGLWNSILDAEGIDRDQKQALKDFLTPLYGSGHKGAYYLCLKGRSKIIVDKLAKSDILLEVSGHVDRVLDDCVSKQFITLYDGEKLPVTSKISSRSGLLYQIQGYEIEYTGTMALSIENEIPGSLRGFLYDGFSIKHELSKEEFLKIYEKAEAEAQNHTGLTIKSSITWPP
jgi:hypothetical protein